MATLLSANFTLEELVHSDYALRHNINNNTKEPSILAALTGLSPTSWSRSRAAHVVGATKPRASVNWFEAQDSISH
jgi:hypothetical protein